MKMKKDESKDDENALKGRRQSSGVQNILFAEVDASFIMKKILLGLKFCHSNNVAHLDIKPENVLLFKQNDPSSLKLVDFGCAKFTHDSRGKPLRYDQYSGTLFFAAPEIISQYSTAEGGDSLKAIDMWAVGVLCFLMITGSRPFYSEVESKLRQAIYECKYEFPEEIPLSTSAKDFVARLLVPKPKDRMNVDEALAHPWISNPEEHASKDSFDPRVLIGIQRYQKQSLFKRLVIRLLCQAMTEKEQEHVQSIFDKFDKDKSGNLEISEISGILKEMFDLDDLSANKEARSVLEHFDSNHDGTLDWEEFARLIVQGSLHLDKSKIRQAFQIIDENADGMISPGELKKALGVGLRQSVAVSENDFIAMIRDLDQNNDGMISFEEFQSQILK
jgi:serine/threonine protein kinase